MTRQKFAVSSVCHLLKKMLQNFPFNANLSTTTLLITFKYHLEHVQNIFYVMQKYACFSEKDCQIFLLRLLMKIISGIFNPPECKIAHKNQTQTEFKHFPVSSVIYVHELHMRKKYITKFDMFFFLSTDFQIQNFHI